MTLRRRTLIASAAALVVLLLLGVVLFFQYVLTAAVSVAIHEGLSPVATNTASLSLAQANAGGALTDFILLDRKTALDDYTGHIENAEALLDRIDTALADTDDGLVALATKARTAQNTWVAVDAEPSIAFMKSDNRGKATRNTTSAASQATFTAMTSASSALDAAVNAERDNAVEALQGFTKLLGFTVLITGLLVLAGLAAFFIGLQRWVLVPLTSVRHDLQRAAREPDHRNPIGPTGPPELRAVAGDAELLRRGLVQEIDEARAAREGLAQDAPLVAAVRAELGATSLPTVPGLTLFGTMQSAEGVMAGDWWDAVATPDGSLAVVVADVSGHGTTASITALRTRAILRSGLEAGLEPDRVLEMAAFATRDDPHFVTAFIAVVDPIVGTLRWANAGHPPAIVVSHDKHALMCEPTGPLLSGLGGEWGLRAHPFGPGDVVVMFTDGLIESRDEHGDELESDAVSRTLRGMDAPVRENPEEVVARLLASARARAAEWRQDDVTVVAVSRPR